MPRPADLDEEPILRVVTVRDEPDSLALDLARRLRGRQAVTLLALGPLDDAQVGRMVRACSTGASEDVVARVRRAADGLPLLVEEMLASPGVPASFADTVRARLADVERGPRPGCWLWRTTHSAFATC